jgi:peptide/nickel transport system substrate-binding protein
MFVSTLAAIVLISACAPAATPVPTLAPPTQAPAQSLPTQAPATTATTAPAAKAPTTPQEPALSLPKGTLRHAHSQAPNTFNPHQTQAIQLGMYYQLVYETLVTIGKDGQLAPQLATEWQISDKAITFKLRPGVVFHDGAPFNAQAVVVNLNDVKNGNPAPRKSELAAVESIEALDDLTVRLNLSTFDPALMLSLARFAGMQISPAALKTADKAPVGTGPWTYNAQDSKTDSKYVFDLFPKYWAPGQAGVARVEIFAITEPAARLNGLQSGEVDTASVASPAAIQQLGPKGYKLVNNNSLVTALHVFDRQGTQIKALGDKRVRQALAVSIDREAFYKTVGVGLPSTQLFPADRIGNVKNLMDLSYNPTRAKTLMTEAGVSNLELSVPTGTALQPTNQALAGFFAPLGVTLKVNTIAPGTIATECASGKWAVAWCPVPELHPKTFVENRLLKNGLYNPFHAEDPRIEELYAKARNLPDEQAADLWAQIMKIAIEEGYIILAGTDCSTCAMVSPKVQGAEARYGIDVQYLMRGVSVGK